MSVATWYRDGAGAVVSGCLGAAASCTLLLMLAGPSQLSAQEVSDQAELEPAQVTVLAPPAEQPTFATHVAPIIQQNCETCHRPGSVAPMPLQTYEEVRAFAPLIRDRVVRRIMPPWPIDMTVGVRDFKNDRSLSDEEVATIVNWIDGGTPMGDPAELPEPVVWEDDWSKWAYEDVMGRPPDLVLTGPRHTVVANGRDQWPLKFTSLEESGGESLTEERWIQAIGARPADPESRYVFHHANVGLTMPGATPDPMERREGNVKLIDTAVGTQGTIFPENTGRVIRPGSTLRWNMHYHPYESDVDAALQLALWFYPKGEEPDIYTMGDVQLSAGQGTFMKGTFPAGDKERHPQVAEQADILLAPNSVTTMRGYHVLDRPAMMNGLRGHMHLRGKYQVVEAVYPDGSWEVISKLNWDHAWHTLFLYEEHAMPLFPTGTVLMLTSVFDNTTENPHNPDPNQWVSLGDRSIDEMSHIRLELTYLSEEEFQRRVEEREAQARLVSSRDG